MTTFKLPDLGEGLQEAEIVAWHVSVGDHVVADAPLVSVETAKAVVEVPSPWAGRISKTYGEPGDVIPVGSALAEIETQATAGTSDAGSVVGRLPTPTAAPAVGAEPDPSRVASAPHVRASPAVRKRAAALGVDLTTVKGSGADGHVALEDVEAAARRPAVSDGWEPLRGVRRAMAEAMARTGADIVAATVTDEAVIAAWSGRADATIRLVRAIAAGCRAAPELNAWFDGRRKARRLHEHIDLGLAMETEDGLFAPVLRNIGERADDDLRAGLEAMKRDVSARSVPLAELRGQTFTLSNFGMLGGRHAALAIVPPQVAILGAGRIHVAPRYIDGEIRAVHVLPLSVTFDHRAITGAEAIRFLTAAIDDLQKP